LKRASIEPAISPRRYSSASTKSGKVEPGETISKSNPSRVAVALEPGKSRNECSPERRFVSFSSYSSS
jgi:hypothetical protein